MDIPPVRTIPGNTSAGWGSYVRNSIKVVVDAYHGSVEFS